MYPEDSTRRSLPPSRVRGDAEGWRDERKLTPSGEIECEANFTRDTATDSLSRFHSFSRSALSPFVPYGQTNALFPVVSVNRGIGSPSNGYSAFPRAFVFFLPSLRFLYFLLCLRFFFLREACLCILFSLLLAPLS